MCQVSRGICGTSLVVQGLRLHAASAGGLGLIPGQWTRSHKLQLQIPYATTNTEDLMCWNKYPEQQNQSINKSKK